MGRTKDLKRSLFQRFPRGGEILLLTLLALAIRVAVAWVIRGTGTAGDENDYFARAAHVLARGEVVGGNRAPCFEVYLALLSRIVGHDLVNLRLASAGLSALVVWPIYHLGERFSGRRVARIAGVLSALYLPLITYGHLLWTESIYTLAALATILATERAIRLKRPALALWAGLGWAGLILCRDVALAVFVTVGLWMVLRRDVWRDKVRVGASLLLAAALPVTAWSAYLNRDNGPDDAFSLLSRTTYLNLYIGNGPTAEFKARYPKRSAKEHYHSLGRDLGRREKRAQPLVWQSIREQGPTWIVEKVEATVPRFFLPGGFPVRRLLIADTEPRNPWSYRGEDGRPLRRDWAQASALAYALQASFVLIIGMLGWALLAGSPASVLYGLMTAFAIGHLWPTILTFSTTRFRMPVEPIFLLGTAYVLAHPLASTVRAPWLTRVIAAALAVLVAWFAVSQFDFALSSRWL